MPRCRRGQRPPADELEPRLRDARPARDPRPRRDPRSPERGQYGFVQALIREVAYGTLARRDRRARHLAAARYFEALGDEELAGALATHYLDAYRAVRRRTGGRRGRRPGADRPPRGRRTRRGAPLAGAGVDLPRAGARRVARPGRSGRPLEQSGAAAQALNHSEVAERHLRDAIDLYRAVGDPSSVARTTAELGLLMVFMSRSGEAIGLLGEALAELADLAADENVVRLQSVLARAFVFHEEPERAIELADSALVAAERLDLARRSPTP